jgi:Family of unknown function (DUF6527)
MTFLIPSWLASAIFALPFVKRPQFVAQCVSETPDATELRTGVLLYELRGGYLKWVHLSCPKCSEHIQLPMVGRERWSLTIDVLRRPTVSPSIWETRSCGAHFFIRKGGIVWC